MKRKLLAIVFLALSVACATSPKDVNREMAPRQDAGDWAGALEVLERSRDAYAGGDELLFELESAMLLHYLGQWDLSNAAFERAKRAAELHYTKSVTRELGTYMINDTTVPYYGLPYERSLIHVISALNFAAQGDLDSAQVEVRQLDAFLRKLRVDGVGGTFRDDGFARLMAGMIWDEGGAPDEAFVAFKLARDAYAAHADAYGVATPALLGRDATRVAMSLGRWATEELAAAQPAPESSVRPLSEDEGRLVLVHHSGRAPYKVEVTFNITVGNGWGFVSKIEGNREKDDKMRTVQGAATGALSRESFQVAVPKYKRVPHRISGLQLRAVPTGETLAKSELVSRPGRVAEKTLEDDIAWIRARAIARATIKYVLARTAEEGARQGGGDQGDLIATVLRIGLGVARNVSEKADLRSWFTAPDEITLTEVVLPAGVHDLEIRYVGGAGAVIRTEKLAGIEVRPGARTWHVVRTVR